LEEELEQRLDGRIQINGLTSDELSMDPSVDSDGYLEPA
jgi:hypothetical protein